MKKIVCDLCEKEFKLTQNKIKTVKVTEDISKMYFKCPKCKHEYLIAYQNREMQDNAKEIQRLYEESKKKELTFQDLEEINKKAEDLKNRNIELNARFIKLFEKKVQK